MLCVTLPYFFILVLDIIEQIVEELEDRFGDSMNDILEIVESTVGSNTTTNATTVAMNGINGHADDTSSNVVMIEESNDTELWDDDADAVYDEEIYDDEGAGAGVEGDLEMDES